MFGYSTGWEKPWVEQIVDRIMKGMLKTTEERCDGVVSSINAVAAATAASSSSKQQQRRHQ